MRIRSLYNMIEHLKLKPFSKKGGYIMIINTLFFIAILLVIIVALANLVLSHFGSAAAYVNSKQAYIAAHSGVEEAIYRLKTGKAISATENLTFSTGSATINTSSTSSGKKVLVTAIQNGYIRNMEIDLNLGTGVAFHYGIQSGQGGFQLFNSSSVTGNVFSSGSIIGAGGNMIYGDVVSSGSSGQIYGIHATGTAFAHIIGNSGASTIIDKDAYYQTIANATVNGTKHPNSTDQPDAALPITDAQITQWESDAAAGGTASGCSNGVYTIKNTTASLGPVKIPCDLDIKGSNVTIGGPVWVTGNITIEVGSTISMASTLGNENAGIIADNQSAPQTSSIITVNSGTTFQGSGTSGSWVFLISQNTSAQNGGSTNAITSGQSSTALVAYAIHGQITLGNTVSLKEVTAYKIVLTNQANVVYDTGLPNALFEAGPGGSYDIIDWIEY